MKIILYEIQPIRLSDAIAAINKSKNESSVLFCELRLLVLNILTLVINGCKCTTFLSNVILLYDMEMMFKVMFVM